MTEQQLKNKFGKRSTRPLGSRFRGKESLKTVNPIHLNPIPDIPNSYLYSQTEKYQVQGGKMAMEKKQEDEAIDESLAESDELNKISGNLLQFY